MPKCLGGITWPMLKVSFGRLKLVCDTSSIHFNYMLEQLSGTKKKCSLRNAKLRANRTSETEETEERKSE